MNEKHVKALLTGAGFTKDVIDALDNEDFNPKEAVEKLNAAQKEHYGSILRNEIEEEIKDDVTKKRDGRWLADLNQAIKKQGVPFDDIKDLEIKDKIKFLSDHISKETQKASGSVAEDYKKAQDEILSLKNQLTEKEDLFKTEIEKVQNQAKAEVTGEKVDMKQRSKFFSIPEEKLIGKKHNEGLYMAYKSVASTKYDFDIDENGDVIAYKKGTKTRVTGKNENGKDEFMGVEDIMKTELTNLGLWVQSNGQGQATTQTTQTTDPNTKQGFKSSRMLEMEKALEK